MSFATDPPRTLNDVARDIERSSGLHDAVRAGEQAVRKFVTEKVSGDPLVKRLLMAARGNDRNRMPRNTEPWMALAEQRLWASLLSGDSPMSLTGLYRDEDERHVRTLLSGELLMSQTFLWSKSVFDAVKECPIPNHVIDEQLLPFPFTYHSFEVSYGMKPSVNIPEHLHSELPPNPESDWLHLGARHAGVSVTENLVGGHGSAVVIVRAGISYGKRYPDDFPPHSIDSTRQVLSLLAFLKSPYSCIEQRLLPRGFRRSGELAASDIDREISVVTLRRSAQEAVDRYNSESKAWKHKWWVAGHFRAQWMPSRQTHEVIWIAPYIKGPSDAPMLQKVYAVTR